MDEQLKKDALLIAKYHLWAIGDSDSDDEPCPKNEADEAAQRLVSALK